MGNPKADIKNLSYLNIYIITWPFPYRPWYHPETSKTDMGREMIRGPIWKMTEIIKNK
jgi:hypothetical protein